MKTLLKNAQTIALIGIHKNAGKTTTLNGLITLFDDTTQAITSIGLDGEAIDQITGLEKPLIVVKKGMIIATAKTCLTASALTYELIKKTDYQTALGPVYIVKALNESAVMLSGPTNNSQLQTLIETLKPYAEKIFIDGALNRMTFSSLPYIDAIILSTGASYHMMMEKTLEKTRYLVAIFSLKKTKYRFKDSVKIQLINPDKTFSYQTKTLNHLQTLIPNITKDSILYISGALTDTMIEAFIKHQKTAFTLILDDPTKILLSHKHTTLIKKMALKLEVINPCNLVALTVNPFSPQGTHYNLEAFVHALQETISHPIYNTMRLEEPYAKN